MGCESAWIPAPIDNGRYGFLSRLEKSSGLPTGRESSIAALQASYERAGSDFVVADMIGVTVVPLAAAETVLAKAREQAAREQRTREWVAHGKTIEDLLKEFGRI